MAKGICSIDGCDGATVGRGWCRRHYAQWWRVGDPVGSSRPSLEERFWPRVNKDGPNGCWLWTGAKISTGYGHLYRGGPRGAGNILAHRLAYELLIGPIPEGLEMDHLCRIPACVNPDHLEPVTRSINQKRGLRGDLRSRS